MLTKEFLAPLLTLFGEHDGFCLTHRIKNHPLFVQTVHRIPVVSFPCACAVMECEKQKREHHLIDFVFVVFHAVMLPFRCQAFN